ncbi:hypothetical protein BDY19DRAFT_469529 [Irpex rosettiformis]|uniref:Uncharacterized protein n=1 Tax=Irpex rosettiformis TaxID=378272 RepID=A0ACB8TSP0_9APHY|nr:hypothetical protein BDY19DRAFT_469529 [Irpex rosettiformis]
MSSKITEVNTPTPGCTTLVHPCLRIAEIQMEVFHYLARKDCVNVARTCSTFYDQAMDVIWAKVKTFIPFVKCMPPEVLTIQTKKDKDRFRHILVTIDFAKEPRSEDWRLFLKHVHRVKEFSDIMFFGRNVDRDYVTDGLTPGAAKLLVSFICERGCLFPKLKTLFVRSVLGERWLPRHLPYISRQTLQSVEFSSFNDDPPIDETTKDMYIAWPEIVPLLRSAWPHLCSIGLSSDFSICQYRLPGKQDKIHMCDQVMSPWLGGLSHLQTFRARLALYPSLLNALSELPLLHTLQFDGSLANLEDGYCHLDSDAESLQLSPSCFPSLKKLHIHERATPLGHPPIMLLQALSHSHTLTDLWIYVPITAQSAMKLTNLFEALSYISLLTDLYVNVSMPYANSNNSGDHPKLALSGQLLSLFFPLHHLQKLSLEFDAYFDVTVEDQNLCSAAVAWPNLRYLSFPSDDYRRTVPTQTTLVGVQALYNGCLYLRTLYMTVNGSLPTIDLDYNGPSGSVRAVDLPAPNDDARICLMDDLMLDFRFHLSDMDPCYRYMDTAECLVLAVRLMFPLVNMFAPGSKVDTVWEDRARKCWWESWILEQDEMQARMNQIWVKASSLKFVYESASDYSDDNASDDSGSDDSGSDDSGSDDSGSDDSDE